MFWKQQGTGPWGNGGDQGGSGSNPWGGKSGGGGQPSPDLEDLIRQGQDKIKKFFPGGKGSFKGFILLLVALFVLWSASGLYRVQPDEQGVELLFGKYVKTTQPGLNYWFPSPIGEVQKPKVPKPRKPRLPRRSQRPWMIYSALPKQNRGSTGFLPMGPSTIQHRRIFEYATSIYEYEYR